MCRSCFVKADNKEPIFVLRARDATAPNAVRRWAFYLESMATENGDKTRLRKVEEALDLANEMVNWQRKNGSKIPD